MGLVRSLRERCARGYKTRTGVFSSEHLGSCGEEGVKTHTKRKIGEKNAEAPAREVLAADASKRVSVKQTSSLKYRRPPSGSNSVPARRPAGRPAQSALVAFLVEEGSGRSGLVGLRGFSRSPSYTLSATSLPLSEALTIWWRRLQSMRYH